MPKAKYLPPFHVTWVTMPLNPSRVMDLVKSQLRTHPTAGSEPSEACWVSLSAGGTESSLGRRLVAHP